MKIQTVVTKNELVELDIQLPFYCKTSASVYYKVVSETKAIRVTHKWVDCINTCNPQDSHTANEITQATACSEQEYEAAKAKVFENIQEAEATEADREEDPNIYHETIIEERLFDESFQNELYEREEGLS
jgi:hypothetical protein